MKNRFIKITVLSVLFCVMCMLCASAVSAEDYTLYVGSVQVTSANASDVLGDGTVSYNEATATLTLTGASITDSYSVDENTTAALYACQSLTIVISGESSLTNNSTGAVNAYGILFDGASDDVIKIVKTANNDVIDVVSADAENVSCGIMSKGSLVVGVLEDPKKSTFTAKFTGADAGVLSAGIYTRDMTLYSNDVVAESGNVNCSDSSVEEAVSAGIYVENSLTADYKYNIAATAGNVTGKGNVLSAGVCVNGNVSFTRMCSDEYTAGDAVTTGSGTKAVSAGFYHTGTSDVVVNNIVYIVATAGNAYAQDAASEAYSYGFYTCGSYSSYASCKLTAAAKEAKTCSVGLYADSASIFNSSGTNPSFFIKAFSTAEDESEYSAALSLDSAVEGTTARNLESGVVYDFDETSGTYVSDNGFVKDVFIEPVVWDEVDILYVGGVEVTEENASDILGDGKVSYDFTSNTLYLENAQISGSYEFAEGKNAVIYFEQNLNVAVTGDCSVVSDTEESVYDYAFYSYNKYDSVSTSYYYNVVLYIYGESDSSKLTVMSADAETASYAVYNQIGDVYFDSLTLDVKSGNAGEISGAVHVGKTANICLHLPRDSSQWYDTMVILYGNLTFNNVKITAVSGNVVNPVKDASSVTIKSSSTFNIYGYCEISATAGNVENALSSADSVAISSIGLVVYDRADITAVAGNVSGNVSVSSTGIEPGSLTLLNSEQDSTVYAYGGNASIISESDDVASEASSNGIGAGIEIAGNNKVYCYGGDCSAVGDEDTSESYGMSGIAISASDNSYIYCEGGSAETLSGGALAIAAMTTDNAEIHGVADKECGAETTTGLFLLYELVDSTMRDAETGTVLVFNSNGSGYTLPDGTYSPEVSVTPGVAVTYGVFVGGVQITEENKDDVFGDGTVSYDPQTKTLTLNNADITGAATVDGMGTAAIYTKEPITIEVKGTNTVTTGTEGSAADMGIVYFGNELPEGTAAITIKGSGTDDVLNVSTSDALGATAVIGTSSGDIVFESVTVNAEGGASGGESYGIISGLNDADDIIVDGAVVNVKAGDTNANDTDFSTSIGAVANNIDVTNNGQFNVIGGDVTASDGGVSMGVYVVDSLNVSNGSSLSGEGGNVTEASGESDGSSLSVGVKVDGTITVGGLSTVSGTGNETTGTSVGVFGTEINLPAGSVTGKTTSENADLAAGLASGSDVSGSKVFDNASGKELTYVQDEEGNGTFVDDENNFSKETTVITYVEFDLWVGGVHVTSLNMNDVLGDGKVSYDPITATLTLDNATVTRPDESVKAAIYSKQAMTVLVKGENTIVSDVVGAGSDYGIVCECYRSGTSTLPAISFNIVGADENASLYVKSNDATNQSSAIDMADVNLVVENLTITAVSGDANKSFAFLASDAKITFNNSNVTAVTGDSKSANYGAGCAYGIDIVGGSCVDIHTGIIESDEDGALNIGLFTLFEINVEDGSEVVVVSGDAGSTVNGAVSAGMFGANINISGNSIIDASCGNVEGNTEKDIVSCAVYGLEGITFTDGTGTIYTTVNCDNPDARVGNILSQNEVSNGTVQNSEGSEILTFNSEKQTYVDSDGNVVKEVVATGGVILFGDYNLVVGDVVVTKENKDDIFGELDGDGATAYYDALTNTLYLDNANITTCFDLYGDGTLVTGVARVGDLNISLIGENKLTLDSVSTTPYVVIGVGAAGTLNITSEKYATLDVVLGEAASENYALLTMSFTGNETNLDIEISGCATVTARAGDVSYTDSATSVGVMSSGALTVSDKASLYGYSGDALPDETSEHTNDGVSAGVFVQTLITVDTTGEVYGKSGTSNSAAMGIISPEITVVNGRVIGDATSEMAEGAISAGVAFGSEPQNVVVYTGVSKDTLVTECTWYFDSDMELGTYLHGEFAIGTYTILLPKKGMSGLEVKKTGSTGGNGDSNGDGEGGNGDEEGGNGDDTPVDDDIISVIITGQNETVIIAFASYDENGRMIDMRYTLSGTADEFGNVSCNTLNMNGAVRVRCFMFGTDMSLAPLCEELERYI